MKQKVFEKKSALGQIDSNDFQELHKEFHQNIKKVNEELHTARDAVADAAAASAAPSAGAANSGGGAQHFGRERGDWYRR